MVEDVNHRRTIRLILGRSFLFLFLAMFFGFIMNIYFKNLLNELSEIRDSDVVGAMGTIYALITAFILVNVWQGLTETQNSFSSENEALIQIWSFVDYFDDIEFSKSMKKVLLAYITSTLRELVDLSSQKKIIFPSKEFTNILKAIDAVKFDDPRDPIAFGGLTQAYTNLSSARAKRIEICLTMMPTILRDFYLITSLIFWIGYLVQGFNSDIVYYTNLFMVSVIVIFAYLIIMDLDRPLKPGLVQVGFDPYFQSIEYIQKIEHAIAD